MRLRGRLPDRYGDLPGLRDGAADALRGGHGARGRTPWPRRHRVTPPGEMT